MPVWGDFCTVRSKEGGFCANGIFLGRETMRDGTKIFSVLLDDSDVEDWFENDEYSVVVRNKRRKAHREPERGAFVKVWDDDFIIDECEEVYKFDALLVEVIDDEYEGRLYSVVLEGEAEVCREGFLHCELVE